MPDLHKCMSDGTGKEINKKQFQDFIKEILFEKSEEEISIILTSKKIKEMSSAAAAVVKTIHEVRYSGDFAKFKPMLDFVFDKDLRARK